MEKLDFWNNRSGKLVTQEQWNSWVWQEQNRITTLEQLKKIIPLNKEQESKILLVLNNYPMAVTPYFASLVGLLYMDAQNKQVADALSKTFLPDINEIVHPSHETISLGVIEEKLSLSKNDGMGEERTTPYSYISQLYPDRILLFVTHYCPFYCRYCFRRRKVILGPNQPKPESILESDNFEKVLTYIKDRPEIRDVILSGGEPLSLNDNQLEKIIKSLRQIDHVKIIRIDTKMPAILPMRITDALVNMLKKYHPIFMTLHFIHPAEITTESKNACEKLVNAGIPLGTYTPVLKGINDDRETLKELFWKLLQARVRPYYLVQFIPTEWTEHFRVPLKKSLSMLEGLHGELSGLAIPSFKVYTHGKGKVPLLPQYYFGRIKEGHLLKTYKGEVALYYEPIEVEGE